MGKGVKLYRIGEIIEYPPNLTSTLHYPKQVIAMAKGHSTLCRNTPALSLVTNALPYAALYDRYSCEWTRDSVPSSLCYGDSNVHKVSCAKTASVQWTQSSDDLSEPWQPAKKRKHELSSDLLRLDSVSSRSLSLVDDECFSSNSSYQSSSIAITTSTVERPSNNCVHRKWLKSFKIPMVTLHRGSSDKAILVHNHSIKRQHRLEVCSLFSYS